MYCVSRLDGQIMGWQERGEGAGGLARERERERRNKGCSMQERAMSYFSGTTKQLALCPPVKIHYSQGWKGPTLSAVATHVHCLHLSLH